CFNSQEMVAEETSPIVYQEKGFKDKERYRNEMEEYREKLEGQLINTAVIPIQQQLTTGVDIEMEDAAMMKCETQNYYQYTSNR
ncbi:hypothetical protein MKX01_022085, partial [Papaver californicum]